MYYVDAAVAVAVFACVAALVVVLGRSLIKQVNRDSDNDNTLTKNDDIQYSNTNNTLSNL